MEFYEHRDAAAALAAMNGRKILGKVRYIKKMMCSKWINRLIMIHSKHFNSVFIWKYHCYLEIQCGSIVFSLKIKGFCVCCVLKLSLCWVGWLNLCFQELFWHVNFYFIFRKSKLTGQQHQVARKKIHQVSRTMFSDNCLSNYIVELRSIFTLFLTQFLVLIYCSS